MLGRLVKTIRSLFLLVSSRRVYDRKLPFFMRVTVFPPLRSSLLRKRSLLLHFKYSCVFSAVPLFHSGLPGHLFLYPIFLGGPPLPTYRVPLAIVFFQPPSYEEHSREIDVFASLAVIRFSFLPLPGISGFVPLKVLSCSSCGMLGEDLSANPHCKVIDVPFFFPSLLLLPFSTFFLGRISN